MQKKLIVLYAVLGIVYAAATMQKRGKADINKNVEGCYVEDLEMVIAVGDSWSSTETCEKYKCGVDRLTYYTCGLVVANRNCKVTRDQDKLYPYCCPRIECPLAQNK